MTAQLASLPSKGQGNDIPVEDRRRHRRLRISADVILTVLVPEETFSPQTVRGAATDISLSGMRVKSWQFQKADYLQLIRGVRYAKIDLFLPFDLEPIPLRARIVWIGYHDDPKAGKPHVDLGLSFEGLPESVRTRLESSIERIDGEARPSGDGLKPVSI